MAKVQSHVTKLLNLVSALRQDHGAELFHAPSGDAYLYAPVFREPGVVAFHDSLPLNSDACGQYLRRQYYNAEGKGLTSSALKDALETLAGSAKLSGPLREVHTRIAGFADRVYLDLANADRQVVAVTADGWAIGSCPADVRFVRRPGMLALATPVSTEERLKDLIPTILNVTDGRSQQLLIAWWLVALRGRKPYFILVLRGEAGSAKSVGSDIIRMVLDPNEANSSSTPKDERDLMIAAKSCHVVSFDNVSFLPEELADALCRLSTGSGLRTRKLTTDDTEMIFKAARPIILNGIPDLLSREDLASRAVLVELDHISEEQRKTEAEVYGKVAEQQPKVLGALLNVIVEVLRRPTFKPTRLPRMADAALTIMAGEEALGWPEGSFLELMDANKEENANALLDGDPIFDALTKLKLPWVGEMKEILQLLPAIDERNRPITAKGTANRLRRLAGALRNVGLHVEPPKGQETEGALRGKRLWRVTSCNTCNTSSYVANLEMKKEEIPRGQRVAPEARVAGGRSDLPF
jgi:hypothetical protein